MSIQIKYTADCDCGGQMSSTTLDLSQDPGRQVEVNLELLGDMTIQCDECGDEAYVPGIADLIEDVD